MRPLLLGMLCIPLLVSIEVEPAVGDASSNLEQGFAQPPHSTKPWCYWYWISDNISKQGISGDLEAMARVGIGKAFIGNIFLDDIPAGDVKVLSDAWWSLVEHAIREGGRTGVKIGMFNCPGWSQSGGPWIKPHEAMRYLVSSETRVKGPIRLERKLTVPEEPFQDVALVAFRALPNEADTLASRRPKITCTPAVEGTGKLVDGRPDTALTFPAGAGAGKKVLTIDIELTEPFTARGLAMIPWDSAWAAQCELQAARSDGQFRTVRTFKFDRSNMKVGVGPMPRGPVAVSFRATTATRFRLLLTDVTGKAALAEVKLSAAAVLESFVEKQLGKMHPTPLPMWDTYLWPTQPEPDAPEQAVEPGQVVDLTEKLTPDGTLRWDVPAGDWVILRTGMTTTGTRNSPASPEGQGLEVDKMNRQAVKSHFDAFIGRLLRRMPASERKALRTVVADSYEMGSQNWTDGFGETFSRRYGYDPTPWLPVLTGRLVGSADQSERFLWDLRRLVADQIALDYVGGLRDLCRANGLELWLENYGHWGFPAEFLQYGGQSDRIGGEFWVTGDLGSIECRAASSCANTYGMPIVSSEAFTGGPPYQTVPSGLKARGDWAFSQGINHFVLHVNIHQPWDDRKPGVNAWFGTEFNRHNTWFDAGSAWIDYLRRCCFLLQQGTRVADVAYFIGEDTPKMTGIQRPALPPGRDFDYINAEVIREKLSVDEGLLTLPHGTTYRVLVLPPQSTMRPALLRSLRDLVGAGATVLGSPPVRSPSLENYPHGDQEVRSLAAELWGDGWGRPGSPKTGQKSFGKGRVIWGKSLDEVFDTMGTAPDFVSGTRLRYTHRVMGEVHIYFVANPEPQEVVTTAAFRAGRKAPELWWPHTGRTERPAVYEEVEGTVRMPIHLGPHGSVFVIFREESGRGQVVSVARNGETLLDTKNIAKASKSESANRAATNGAATNRAAANTFTIAMWVKPSADTTLPPEMNRGGHGLGITRNDAIFPTHGAHLGGAGHAGAGLAVGRNGVCVFEHGAGYFAPVLVHPRAVTDWTHVVVVYRDGRPSLYLDGRFVHEGLKSDFTVHPSTGSGSGAAPFRGEMGPIERFARALTQSEVTALVKSMRRPGVRHPAGAIELTRGESGAVEAVVWQSGDYTLRMADGQTRSLGVPTVPKPARLAGPWEVQFTSGLGAPQRVTFQQLKDWTQRSEEAIRYYSGTATYRKTFILPASMEGKRLSLDLGEVRDLATVRLNGRNLGTVWLAPWRVDVAAAARPGDNLLEIDLVNPWNNRLVGDAKLPPAKRYTFLAKDTLPKNAPLLPAGLLGPVTLQAAVSVEIR